MHLTQETIVIIPWSAAFTHSHITWIFRILIEQHILDTWTEWHDNLGNKGKKRCNLCKWLLYTVVLNTRISSVQHSLKFRTRGCIPQFSRHVQDVYMWLVTTQGWFQVYAHPQVSHHTTFTTQWICTSEDQTTVQPRITLGTGRAVRARWDGSERKGFSSSWAKWKQLTCWSVGWIQGALLLLSSLCRPRALCIESRGKP